MTEKVATKFQAAQTEVKYTEGIFVVTKNCKNCEHVRVCAVYQAITALVETSPFAKVFPFKPEDVAKICEVFKPAA